MNTKQGQVGWWFWSFWILANLAGWIISIGVCFLFAVVLGAGEGYLLFILYIGIPVCAGILTSFAEWVVLRRYVPRVSLWAISGLVGWSISCVGAYMIMFNSNEFLIPVFLWSFPGISGMLIQWWILRQHSSKAKWWFVSDGLILILGLTLMYVLAHLHFDPSAVMAFFMLGSIPISGGILVWILRDYHFGINQVNQDSEISSNKT